MTLIELQTATVKWAHDRNLVLGSTPRKQFLKLMEEAGELCAGIAKGKPDLIKDSIGDICVVMSIMSAQLGLEFEFVEYEIEPPFEPTTEIEYHITDLYLVFGHLARSLNIDPVLFNSLAAQMLALNAKLVFIARHYGTTLCECFTLAYDEIKDRKGRLVDGVFVKDGDL